MYRASRLLTIPRGCKAARLPFRPTNRRALSSARWRLSSVPSQPLRCLGFGKPSTLSFKMAPHTFSFFRGYADPPEHTPIMLPALSPTMETGTILSWDKQEGDAVEEGDTLAQVETDKATMDMEAPSDGYLAKILVPAGTKDIPLGKLLCIMVEEQSDIAAFKDYQSPEDKATPTADKPAEAAPPPPPPPPPSQPLPPSSAPPPSQASGPAGRLFASPYAKTLAAEKGINLQTVTGSGPEGRIISRDLLSVTPPTPSPVTVTPGAAYTDIELTNMRKTIATRLLQSKQTVPHYYLTIDVNMDKIVELRGELNDLANGDYKLSPNDFIIMASAQSMKKVPEVNSSWMEDFIRRYHAVDISVAVSTEAGLITPIVKDAHVKGLRSIHADVVELAERARAGKLQPHEFQGGTFTISNLGMFGIKQFTAVINPPQSCILAVGATEKRIVVDKDASRQYRVANVMSVTLSCDHRVVDGAIGATWLSTFKSLLENPSTLLL